MGIFTLTTTTTVAVDVNLIPNANGCATQLTPVGAANNWDCVNDPIGVPDENSTYVNSNATNLKYDLYNIPNHTTESGTINYVQIYARGKSHETSQHADGIYKIILTDDNCGNIYKSNDIDLITSYNTYNNVWKENPRTTSAWIWADMDNLQIGIESSSPSVSGSIKELVIRPSGVGDVTELGTCGILAPNWTCVNEATKDDFTSTVCRNSAGTKVDFYQLPDHTTETGAITKVSIFAYVYSNDDNQSAKTAIKTHGVEYYGDENEVAGGIWQLISTDHATNPNTGNTWTWAEIDALQGGVELQTIGGEYIYCTQVYVVISYRALDFNPQIRTTQCYAKVNYNTELTCTMDKPEEISVDHDQNIKMLNFWSGRRAVYSPSRNNRTMVMTGTLYSDTACETIECVRLLAEAGGDVAVSGLGSYNYDKVFKIASFGWDKISDKPLAYRWILEMEYIK